MSAIFDQICVNLDAAVGSIHQENYLNRLRVWRFF